MKTKKQIVHWPTWASISEVGVANTFFMKEQAKKYATFVGGKVVRVKCTEIKPKRKGRK